LAQNGKLLENLDQIVLNNKIQTVKNEPLETLISGIKSAADPALETSGQRVLIIYFFRINFSG
jgi:hypothetical protein